MKENISDFIKAAFHFTYKSELHIYKYTAICLIIYSYINTILSRYTIGK